MTPEPDLFAPVLETPTRLIRGKVRGTDPIESQAAAVAVLPKLTAIQTAIMHALASHPFGLTAKEIEQMPDFRGLAPSSARKRCTEMCQSGHVVRTEQRRGGCAVLVIAPAPEKR